jgi:hypothetical protein
MEREVVDVIVLQDGENRPFFSYMDAEQANMIANCGGLSQAECVNLRETKERPVPQSLKDGQSTITDVLVRLQPNIAIYLN